MSVSISVYLTLIVFPFEVTICDLKSINSLML